MPRFIKFIVYPVVFLFSYLLFLYWMLPMNAVKRRAVAAVEQTLGRGYGVEIGEIGAYRFSGAKISGFALSKEIEGKKLDIWRAEQFRARAGIFSLLFGSPRISFDAEAGSTTLEGTFRDKEGTWIVDVDFDGIDFSKMPFLRKKTGLRLISNIGGEVALEYNYNQPLRTEGAINIAFDQLLLKEGTLQLGEMGSFPLPDLSLAAAKSELKAKVNQGSVNVENLRLKGKDLELNLKGRIFLAKEAAKYRLNLQGNFQFSDTVWKILDPLIPETKMNDLNKQKNGDGTYPLSISGQASSPQIYSGSVKLYPFQPF